MSNFFLHSTVILICWVPCISSNLSRVLGVTSTGGTTFTATTCVTLMPLAIVIGMAIRFFTTTATCLLPEITLVYMFTTLKPWGKWGPSTPSGIESLHACCFPGARFCLAVYYFGQKIGQLFLICQFDHLIQFGQIHCLVCDSFPLNWKSCWMTSQQSGYPPSIQGNWQLINFTFLDHADDLIDDRCTQVTST